MPRKAEAAQPGEEPQVRGSTGKGIEVISPRERGITPRGSSSAGNQTISADCFLNFQISEVRRGDSHPFYLSAKGCQQNTLWEEGVSEELPWRAPHPGFVSETFQQAALSWCLNTV